MMVRRTFRPGFGDVLPPPVTGSGAPFGGATLPNCPAGTLGTASSLFMAGVQEGFQDWKDNLYLAPIHGVVNFGLPGTIQHLPDGSYCGPPSWGQDAIMVGAGRALVTVLPVLFLAGMIFTKRGR